MARTRPFSGPRGWLLALPVVFTAAARAEEARMPDEDRPGGRTFWVYVGTYTGGEGRGIYRLELDPAGHDPGQPDGLGRVAFQNRLVAHRSLQLRGLAPVRSRHGLEPSSATPLEAKP